MIISSASGGDFRLWLLPLIWGLVIVSLISGYSIHIGKWTGWRFYSRKSDPSGFWIDWPLKLIFAVVITYFLLNPDSLPK